MSVLGLGLPSPIAVHALKSPPTQGSRAGTPVVGWIHGGGFTGDAGQDTNPREFVQLASGLF